jgi:pimeloyl-ACP methyl ester carboxylesterase
MMKKINYLLAIIVVIMINSCATSSFYNLPTKEFDDIDYTFEVKKQKVRNIEIAYIDEGKSDEVLLLIHGLGTSAKSWLKNIPQLSKEFRVIAVDLPGYGKSDKGYYQYSMSWNALVLTEFLDELNIGNATFVGHSMGGQISLHAALNHPEKVKNLILISSAGFEKFTEGEGDWMKAAFTIDLIKDTPIRNIDINLRANFYETPEDAEFFITDRIQLRGAKGFEDYCYAVTRNVAGMIDEPVLTELQNIKNKALILFGENDGLIPNPYLHGGYTENIAQFANSELPNSKLVMIPKCGHMMQFEKAEQVNKEIIQFIKN